MANSFKTKEFNSRREDNVCSNIFFSSFRFSKMARRGGSLAQGGGRGAGGRTEVIEEVKGGGEAAE